MDIFENYLEDNQKGAIVLKQRFEQEYNNAKGAVNYMSTFIEAINVYNPLFENYYSYSVKQLFLSLRSVLELQWTEYNMNLRHSLEGACIAAFALTSSTEEVTKFIENLGALESRKQMDTAYTRISRLFPNHSEKIRNIKEKINKNYSHALAVPTFGQYATRPVKGTLSISLRDTDDEYHIRCHLFLVANTALTIADLLLYANHKSKIFSFRDLNLFHTLDAENQSIRKQLSIHPRTQQ